MAPKTVMRKAAMKGAMKKAAMKSAMKKGAMKKAVKTAMDYVTKTVDGKKVPYQNRVKNCKSDERIGVYVEIQWI